MFQDVRRKLQNENIRVSHSDLHSDNVMIDRSGVPWIIDFTYNPDGMEMALHAPMPNVEDLPPRSRFLLPCVNGTINSKW
jgi:hypothetical protein